MNKRRKLIIALGGGALAAPLYSLAQSQGKVWRIGFLSQRRVESLDSDAYGGFVAGMRELGYVEGKNLSIEWRFADGDATRLPGLATELVRLKVDAIVVAGSPTIRAAQHATSSIPIIIGTSADPVSGGFVASLARPGGNTTGLGLHSEDLSPKRLELLLSVAPGLSRVAVLVNPAGPEVVALKNLQDAAQRAGVTIVIVEARNSREIDDALHTMTKEQVEGFIFVSTSLFMQHRQRIVDLAARNRLPFVSSYREYVEAGGLMSYGPSLAANYRRAASYVDRIFKGANPGELPIEQPTAVEFFINTKAAKALGLEIPQSLLISADKLIQ